jgi:hypothetical protein
VFGGSSPHEILLDKILFAEHKSTINRLDAADPAWDGPKVGEGGSNGDARAMQIFPHQNVRLKREQMRGSIASSKM